MRIKGLILADAVVLQPDGKTVIFGAGIDRIMATQFPWAQAQLSVFVSLQGEGDQDGLGTAHDLRIRILSPNSDLIAELGGPFTVASQYPDADARQGLQNAGMVFQQVQFPAEGEYTVEVVVDETEREAIQLHVVPASPTPTEWTHVPSVTPSQS